MRRLRLLGVLLPAALFLFVALVVFGLVPLTVVQRVAVAVAVVASRQERGFSVVNLRGVRPVLDFDAELVAEGENGKVHL